MRCTQRLAAVPFYQQGRLQSIKLSPHSPPVLARPGWRQTVLNEPVEVQAWSEFSSRT